MSPYGSPTVTDVVPCFSSSSTVVLEVPSQLSSSFLTDSPIFLMDSTSGSLHSGTGSPAAFASSMAFLSSFADLDTELEEELPKHFAMSAIRPVRRAAPPTAAIATPTPS